MNTDPNTLVLSLLQTAATLQNHGFSDEETRKRLMEEIGITEDNAAQLISALPEFFRKTDGAGRVAGPPKVFISQSHRGIGAAGPSNRRRTGFKDSAYDGPCLV